MRLNHISILAFSLVLGLSACKKKAGYGEYVEKAKTEHVKIIPIPKIMQDQYKYWLLPKDAKIVLITGKDISGPEQHGTEMFVRNMKKRFGVDVEVSSDADAGDYDLAIRYGSKEANKKIAEIAEKNTYQLDNEIPGQQGFIIEMYDNGARNVLLGATDGRGALYGQLSLFELFEKGGDGIRLNLVSLADWPTIKNRGRVGFHTGMGKYPDLALDAHVFARQNYFTVKKYKHGQERELNIDVDEFLTNLEKARKRGFKVYGRFYGRLFTDEPDSMQKEIDELLSLADMYLKEWKLDGIWACYDDPGMDPNHMLFIKAFMDYVDREGLDKADVYFLPDDPGYKKIDYLPNLKIMQGEPRMKEITWVFTLNPDEYQANLAKEVGLKQPLVYWWNWPRVEAGFTMPESYNKQDTGNKPVYYYPQRSRLAWPYGFGVNPDYESQVMRQAGKYMSTALQLSADWQDEYMAIHFGLWAWNPEDYQFSDVTQYAREVVFGRELAHIAAEFDWTIQALKQNFNTETRPWKLEGDPVRYVHVLAKNLAKNLHYLRDNPHTLTSAERYHDRYIVPMENLVRVAFRYLDMEYRPEDYEQFELPDEMRNIRFFEFVEQVEGAQEAEKLDVVSKTGGEVKYHSGDANNILNVSNNWVLGFHVANHGQASCELGFDAPAEGIYTVEVKFVGYKKSPPKVTVFINGNKMGSENIRCYEQEFKDVMVKYENIELKKGRNTIRLEPIGSTDENKLVMIDYIKIVN